MDHAELVDAAASELDAFDEALASGPITAPVPTCPGWTLADLAGHVGDFMGFWAHVLCEGSGRPKTPAPDRPEGDELVPWSAELGRHLLDELRATPADTRVWTWYDVDPTAGFVARRVANELAVHRFDAESARGTCRPIPVELAADGIDEMVRVLVLARARSGQSSGQTLHLHGTDADDAEWLVTLLADRVEVSRQHAKADLALRGPVSDLELLLYGRPPLGDVERFGDQAVLDLWYREFVF